MITDPEGTVLTFFAAFCRIGTCVLLLPGIGGQQVPGQVRLFLAVALSLALVPLVWSSIYPLTAGARTTYISVIGSEILIGATLGIIARLYVLALQFGATALSMMVGFNTLPTGTGLDATIQTEFANLIAMIALFLLILFDFHHIIIAALTDSYDFMPVGTPFNSRLALVSVADTLAQSFMLVTRLISPFIVFALVFNIAIGLVNKLAPQIPVYFISMPFIIAGGLLLFYFAAGDFYTLYIIGFETIFLDE